MVQEQTENHFSKEVLEKLGHYVYRLIDPRSGNTFYVGKGQGNRVFQHVKAALEANEGAEEDLRLATIREIKSLNLEPIHIIHRHGMNEEVALEVEAALIDAYPGLTNRQSGQRSNDYGIAHVDQLEERYAAETIEYNPKHKVMVIKIHPATVVERGGIYEAVRGTWRVNKSRANQAHYIVAIIDGMCRAVYTNDGWEQSEDGRFEFNGKSAEDEIWNHYVNKSLPEDDRKKGMASPFLYRYP